MIVSVAVADGAAVDNHATVGEVLAHAVLGVRQLFHEAAEGLEVELVDVLELLNLLLVAFVVGELVVAGFYANLGEGAIGAVVCLEEGDDARRVGAEGEQHELVHGVEVFAVGGRNALG